MKKESGMTLIELMITVSVIVIMLAVGLPMYESVRGRGALVSETNKLVKALNLARSTAISRGLSISVCPSNAVGTCVNAVSVVCDDDWLGNLAIRTTTDDDLLRIIEGEISANLELCSADTTAVITFKYDGTIDASTHFLFQSTETNKVRCLEVRTSGQVSSEKIDKVKVGSDYVEFIDTSSCTTAATATVDLS